MVALYKGYSLAGTTKKSYLTIKAAQDAAERHAKRKYGSKMASGLSYWAIDEEGNRY
jgi:hypothetical protein